MFGEDKESAKLRCEDLGNETARPPIIRHGRFVSSIKLDNDSYLEAADKMT